MKIGKYRILFDFGLRMWRETCVVLAFDWYRNHRTHSKTMPIVEIMFFNMSLQILKGAEATPAPTKPKLGMLRLPFLDFCYACKSDLALHRQHDKPTNTFLYTLKCKCKDREIKKEVRWYCWPGDPKTNNFLELHETAARIVCKYFEELIRLNDGWNAYWDKKPEARLQYTSPKGAGL